MKNKYFGHYTNQRGLLGIMGSESLWATNIKFLNDEYEFQHALDLIKDIIQKSNMKMGYPDYDVYEKYVAELKKQLESLNSYKSESIFTLSFSEETDLLSQWRGYCPENNGYCIIFDVATLFDRIKEIYGSAHFVEYVYEEDRKISQIKEVFNKNWKEYLDAKDEKKKKKLLQN